jgi:ribonuclease HI
VRALAGLEVHVWTDGAASGNPGPAGSGFVLLFREHRKEASIWLGDATNNVAELTAVLVALRSLKRRDVPVRVHSDSSYVIGVVTGAMRAKANRELVEEIRDQVARFADLRFVKVEAHAGVEWNERADALARQAIRARASRTVDTRA